MSFNRLVDLLATTPAKMFGLYPRKGTIQVGSDADLVVFDPGKRHVISSDTHHMNVDYNAYEGTQVQGVSEIVISRGRVVVEDNVWHGRAGGGNFIKRGLFGGPF